MALQKSKIEPRAAIFIDTSAFIGLLVPDDEFNETASNMFEEIIENQVHLVTTEMILFELANGLSKSRYRQAVAEVIDDLIKLDDTTVIWSNFELFSSAYEMYKLRPDKNWSLTD
ncbi:MAG: type II toxin-antitoxin system VapC family toxin [Pyrinomonadaceae bacterium]